MTPTESQNAAPASEVLPPEPWSPVVWRQEPPDRPGWWWMDSPQRGRIAVEEVVELNGRLFLKNNTDADPFEWYEGSNWAGPLEPPPPPDCQETL